MFIPHVYIIIIFTGHVLFLCLIMSSLKATHAFSNIKKGLTGHIPVSQNSPSYTCLAIWSPVLPKFPFCTLSLSQHVFNILFLGCLSLCPLIEILNSDTCWTDDVIWCSLFHHMFGFVFPVYWCTRGEATYRGTWSLLELCKYHKHKCKQILIVWRHTTFSDVYCICLVLFIYEWRGGVWSSTICIISSCSFCCSSTEHLEASVTGLRSALY